MGTLYERDYAAGDYTNTEKMLSKTLLITIVNCLRFVNLQSLVNNSKPN